MTWVLLLTAAWLAASLPLALLVCRSIRAADREARGSHGRRRLSLVPLGESRTPVPRVAARRGLRWHEGAPTGRTAVTAHRTSRRRAGRH